MTITNDERREIAARLREDIGLHAFAEIFGFSWTDDERDWYWRDVTAKVADYIEPEPERTCQNITRHPHYGFECSECGWDAYEPNDYGNDVRFDEFSYCPKCGCKVEQ